MSLLDILSKYLNPTPASAVTSEAHFDEVARSVSPSDLGQGVSAAFRSDQTPPFGTMVGDLFGRSDPQQRAGLLNQILGSLGPAGLAGIGGDLLKRLRGDSSTSAIPTVSANQADQLTPDEVRDIATHAEGQDPSIVDKVGDFYAHHPDLVKGIGAMGLALVLGKLAKR
ncbi:MAG: hypothetical protein ABI887_04345 [Burkholderiales bacterium]